MQIIDITFDIIAEYGNNEQKDLSHILNWLNFLIIRIKFWLPKMKMKNIKIIKNHTFVFELLDSDCQKVCKCLRTRRVNSLVWTGFIFLMILLPFFLVGLVRL